MHGRRVARVADQERHAVGDARGGGVLPRLLDRGDVEVEADDASLGERGRQRDGRPADTAARVEHRAAGVERRGAVGQRVHPGAHLVDEAGTVQRAEALAQLGAVLVERHAAALAEVGDDLGEREGDAREQARHRCGVRRVRLVDEHGHVVGGQREASRLVVRLRVAGREDAGRRLLLEPLPRVSGCRAGDSGESGGGHRPVVAECAIQPEAAPELDGEQRRGGAEHADELLGELADAGGLQLLGGWGDGADVVGVGVGVGACLGVGVGQDVGHGGSLRRRSAARECGTGGKSTPMPRRRNRPIRPTRCGRNRPARGIRSASQSARRTLDHLVAERPRGRGGA